MPRFSWHLSMLRALSNLQDIITSMIMYIECNHYAYLPIEKKRMTSVWSALSFSSQKYTNILLPW